MKVFPVNPDETHEAEGQGNSPARQPWAKKAEESGRDQGDKEEFLGIADDGIGRRVKGDDHGAHGSAEQRREQNPPAIPVILERVEGQHDHTEKRRNCVSTREIVNRGLRLEDERVPKNVESRA